MQGRAGGGVTRGEQGLDLVGCAELLRFFWSSQSQPTSDVQGVWPQAQGLQSFDDMASLFWSSDLVVTRAEVFQYCRRKPAMRCLGTSSARCQEPMLMSVAL
jgi:hypothetical protein